MPVLDVDSDKLFYVEEGAGTPILFVHGSCGSGAQWKALSLGLQDGYRTICIDNLGNGRNQPWPIERVWTPADDERAWNMVLDHIGEPVHLVAHSSGASNSYQILKDRADQILSATLFEPVCFQLLNLAGDPLFEEPVKMGDDYRAAMDAGEPDKAMACLVDGWAQSEGAWDGLPDMIKDLMRVGVGKSYHEWRRNQVEHPNGEEWGSVTVPILLFKGSLTISSMHGVCELLCEALPGCRYIEIEGAGHMSPFTHAAAALPHIKEHLSANDRAA